MLSFEISGTPIPLARPRFYTRGPYAHVYDSQKKEKEKYQWQLRSQYHNEPLTVPVYIDISFFMPIPKSTSSVKKRQMANRVIHHIKRPDLDNLQKFVLDCLNTIVLRDDSQVVEMRARKVYAEQPGTLVKIVPVSIQNILEGDEDYLRDA